MDQVHIREACSEVLIFLDKNVGNRVLALEEAIKILQREVIRERTNSSRYPNRKLNSDFI